MPTYNTPSPHPLHMKSLLGMPLASIYRDTSKPQQPNYTVQSSFLLLQQTYFVVVTIFQQKFQVLFIVQFWFCLLCLFFFHEPFHALIHALTGCVPESVLHYTMTIFFLRSERCSITPVQKSCRNASVKCVNKRPIRHGFRASVCGYRVNITVASHQMKVYN